jgi:hypothetical protein
MKNAFTHVFILGLAIAGLSGCGGESSVDGGIPDGSTDAGDAGVDGGVAVFHVVQAFPPTGPAGKAYNFTFTARDGQPPYKNWSVIKGALPKGLVLDGNGGTLSGTPEAEGFSYFVVSVGDSAGSTARELFGMRVGDPASEGPMKSKAAQFLEIYEKKHIWHGWSLNMFKPDDPNGDYQLSTYGDSSFMGGQCTLAMAFRQAVEKTPESLATIRTLTDGWRFFQRLTGVPGLSGRGFAWKDDPSENGMKEGPFWPDDPNATKYKGTGEFDGWVWIGDASRDQYSGAVLGNALAYDLVDDPQVKENTRTFLTALADHVWDNGLKIMDPGGRMTKYGDMDGEKWEGFPVPNGQSAVCDLAWFKTAYHVSGEERFAKYYRELAVKRKYVDIMRDYQWVYMGYSTKYYNVYMSNENWYILMRLENDPAFIQRYREIYRDTLWLNTKDTATTRRGIREANAVTGPWYMYSTGDRDPEVLYDTLWQMTQFQDPPFRDHVVENSKDPDIVKNPAASEPEAMYPLPFYKRAGDMVVWHRSPYALDGGSDSGEERTGCDYLLPYYMGRYYGYIGQEW